MTISLHLWLRLLISFLGLWGCGYAANIAWKRKREKGLTMPTVTRMERIKAIARTTAMNTGKIGLGVVLGTLLGVQIRDRQLLDNRHTYFDVSILDKYSEKSFLFQPARMQDYKWDFCEAVPFRKYQQLKFITYEQQSDCKRLEYFKEKETKGAQQNVELSLR